MKPDIKKYDAVVFDLFHTLVSLGNTAGQDCNAWDYLGISEERWRHALFSDAEGRLRGDVKHPNEVIRDIVCKIEPSVAQAKTERAAQLRLRQFETVLSTVDPDVMDTIRKLKQQGKALGLISNADSIEIDSWFRTEISTYFDSAVFSCHTGYVKPEKEIYLHSLEQLRVGPDQCLFIGDGGNDELSGAKMVGIDTAITLQFLDGVGVLSQRRAQADFEIQHIAELLA